jgi:hypothetical protein
VDGDPAPTAEETERVNLPILHHLIPHQLHYIVPDACERQTPYLEYIPVQIR